MPGEKILFVTGKLAADALRQVVTPLAAQIGFACEIAVLNITVAALMHVDWIARKLPVIGPDVSRIILPGWVQGSLDRLIQQYGRPVELGPKDLFDLPEYFGKGQRQPVDLSQFDIEILAEINHAPRMSLSALIREAETFRTAGADWIDLGCIPGERWSGIAAAVRELRSAGLRVSVDSFDRDEVEQAVAAGAELVLSCNGSNRDWAGQLPAELVVIPDDPRALQTMDDTVQHLREQGCRFRLDPILEPIGFGFAGSLQRYWQTREKYPDLPMLMGVGNLTELTEVDCAGVNLLLAAICQELQIHSVLTTQVVNWCRTAVREFDLARRQVKAAVDQRRLPKHLDSRLLTLRSSRLREPAREDLRRLQAQLRDRNFRIFVADGEIHLLNGHGYWHGTDAYALYDQLGPIEPSHSFYLGYELSKARTALTLGKIYRQDEALDWGYLTVHEPSAIHRRKAERLSTGSIAGTPSADEPMQTPEDSEPLPDMP